MKMPRNRLALLVPVVLLLVSFVWPAYSVLAQASKTLVWDRYDVTLNIQPDGTLRVVETQTITFTSGSFTFGYATIPLDKTDGIADISLREGDHVYRELSSEAPYTFSADVSASSVDIYWYFPRTSNSTHTYVLEYAIKGGVRIHDTGDKLQWIAISGERDFPIENASVTVNLPPGATFLSDPDSAGVRAEWQKSADGRSVTYTAQGEMAGYGTLEVGVEFTHGVIPSTPPAWQAAVDQSEYYDQTVRPLLNLGLGVLGILLVIGGPLAVYLLWYLRGRDPQVGPVPEYLAEPPDDLPPGLIGTLVDEQADMRDIIASLVDLARRGFIEMKEIASKGAFGTSAPDHVFRKLQGPKGLTKFEREVMAGVFGGKEEVKLSDLRNKFYTHLPGIQKALYEELVTRKFFNRSPQATRQQYTALGMVLLFGAGCLGLFVVSAASASAGAIICPFAGLGAMAVALLFAGPRMPAKTRAGAEQAAKWRAFKTYLQRIETLTDLKSASDLFDRFLPFAIAFGLDQSWVSKFSKAGATPVPGWYVPYPYGGYRTMTGGGRGLASPPMGGSQAPGGMGGLQGMSDGLAGGLQSMSNGLSNMLNSAGRVMGSVPQSSGSGGSHGWSGGGGFSGGGFSGGGGGGGGGRGFG